MAWLLLDVRGANPARAGRIVERIGSFFLMCIGEYDYQINFMGSREAGG
jgi:hypothetical protein